jgi:hypothetical protein
MFNMLRDCKTKGEYRRITSVIKDTIKSIRDSKALVDIHLWEDPIKNQPKLFEVEPTPISHQEYFQSMDSFFGEIE